MALNNTAGAPLILLAVIAVMVFMLRPPAADAHDSTADVWLACERVTVALDRLACFDNMVRHLKAGGEAAIETPAKPPVADVGRAPPKASQPALATVIEAPAKPPVADVDRAPPKASPPVVAAATDIPEDFGLKEELTPEAKKKMRAKPGLIAKVVRHWENGRGRLVVQLDNDQIWTEVVSHDARIPKGEVTVEIKPGGFGGYRMRINDNFTVVRVKRLK